MPACDIPTTQYRIGGSGAGILDLVARLCRNSARHRGEREFAPHLGDIDPLVTPDAVPPGARGLRIQGRLNGRVMQDSRTDLLIFGVAALIELISVAMSLERGDVIITGTPGGVGAARKPPVFMQPGDTFEVEIDGLGVLTNPVEDG
jgi:2-keto-4-pentenoate hydratase/2-oxohepta-3-ene-1,7-dioic acid hydratase in catechol pathway